MRDFPRLFDKNRHLTLRDSGFSYIEMIISIGVVGVIGSVATVKMVNNREGNVSVAVAQIFIGDLAFAQNLAMSTNKGVVMTFSAGCDDGENDGDHNHGHGNDGDHDDDDNPGNGNGNNGNGNNGNGNGNNGNGNGNNGNGNGQGQDDDDDHDNGYGNDDGHGKRHHGRGHGRGYGQPHDCDDGCDDSSGGYVLTFADGSPLPYPQAASMTTVNSPVTIAAATTTFRFDSVGRLIVPGYQWATGQTSLIIMTINDNIGIQVTRETGKTTIINL